MKPPIPRNVALATAAAGSAAKASPEHKRFQTLLAQIDKARQRLQAWQEQLPLAAAVHAAQVQPLIDALATSRRALVFELEARRADKHWTKAERATMSEWIADVSSLLLDTADAPDDELKSLHDRHADVAYDAREQDELASMQAMFEEVGGFDFGDAPVASADELMRRAHEQMTQRRAQGDAASAADAADPTNSTRRRKPPRQTAAQRRAADDAQRVSHTVREVYRKLASALHPDRAPADATADERAARTAQMQRANTAYEAADLLALLALQLEIEQVDAAHVAGVAAGQVRHFNKVLAEQLRELQDEIDARQDAFCDGYGILAERRIDPDRLGAVLRDSARQIAAGQLQIDMQRRVLQGAPDHVKRMLRQWRKAQQQAADDFFF